MKLRTTELPTDSVKPSLILVNPTLSELSSTINHPSGSWFIETLDEAEPFGNEYRDLILIDPLQLNWVKTAEYWLVNADNSLHIIAPPISEQSIRGLILSPKHFSILNLTFIDDTFRMTLSAPHESDRDTSDLIAGIRFAGLTNQTKEDNTKALDDLVSINSEIIPKYGSTLERLSSTTDLATSIAKDNNNLRQKIENLQHSLEQINDQLLKANEFLADAKSENDQLQKSLSTSEYTRKRIEEKYNSLSMSKLGRLTISLWKLRKR